MWQLGAVTTGAECTYLHWGPKWHTRLQCSLYSDPPYMAVGTASLEYNITFPTWHLPHVM